MKQTKNALSMLLNAYRSVFKSAYFKGMASAVILTAGLAAGTSANAAWNATINDWQNESGSNLVIAGSGDTTWNTIRDYTSGNYTISTGITVSGESTATYHTISAASGDLTITSTGDLKLQSSNSGANFNIGRSSAGYETNVTFQNVEVTASNLNLVVQGGTNSSGNATLNVVGNLTASRPADSSGANVSVLASGGNATLNVSGTFSATGNEVTVAGSGASGTATLSAGTMAFTDATVNLTSTNAAAQNTAVLGDKDSEITLTSTASGATTLTMSGGAGVGSGSIINGKSLTLTGDNTKLVVDAGAYAEIAASTLNLNGGEISTSGSSTATALTISSDTLNITAGTLSAGQSGTITITSHEGTMTGGELSTESGGKIDINLDTYTSSGDVATAWEEGAEAGSLTVSAGEVKVNGLLAIKQGTVTIGDDVTLYTTNANASSTADAGVIKIRGEGRVGSGDESTLAISQAKLAEFLNGTADVTFAEESEESVQQGLVEFLNGGVIDFGDEVTLSNFNFNACKGSIAVTNSGSVTADKIIVEHELTSNKVTVSGGEVTNNSYYTSSGDVALSGSIADSQLNLEASELVFGADYLHSVDSANIAFKSTTVTDSVEFITDGTTAENSSGAYNEQYTGFQLATGITLDNPGTEVDGVNGKVSEYLTGTGTISGAVRVQSGGSLNVVNGDWTASDVVTLFSGGAINVTASQDNSGGDTDATLTLSQGLVLDLSEANAQESTITVSGGIATEYDLDDDDNDDNLALLDLTSGLTMVGYASGEKTVYGGKATITATSGGVVLLNAEDLNTILGQNDYTDNSGAAFVANSGGKFVVEGDISVTSYDAFGSNADSDVGIVLSAGGEDYDAGILEADSLSVVVNTTNEDNSAKAETSDQYSGQGTLDIGGTVRVDDFVFSDHTVTSGDSKPDSTNRYVTQVTLKSGTVEIANSLSSDNYRLVLGSADETNGSAASLVFSTDAYSDEGTIGGSLKEIRVDSGSITVENGVWTAENVTFNLSGSGAELTIGGNSLDEDVNGDDVSASLTAYGIELSNSAATLTVASNGSATFSTADFSGLTTQNQAGVKVSGSLTILGDEDATILSGDTTVDDPANGVKFGSEGTIQITSTGVLTFGEAAMAAVFADGDYTASGDEAAAAVSGGVADGYTKIANSGGELVLSLSSSTVFSADAIQDLKQALFTSGSLTDLGNGQYRLVDGGVLNIGDASFYGINVTETVIGGVSGYTAKWDDLEGFSDVYGTDVTNNTLTQTNVTGITVDDEVQGHWGSLSMDESADYYTNPQVKITGDTSLRFAEGNNGYFISDAEHSQAYGAIVSSGHTLTLINGGEIGDITLEAGVNDGNVMDDLTTLVVTGGDTVIASITGSTTGFDDNNFSGDNTYVNIESNTTVTGDITGVQGMDVSADLTASDIEVGALWAADGANVTADNITVFEAEADGSVINAGTFTLLQDTAADPHYSDLDIYNGGRLNANVFNYVRKDSGDWAIIQVGAASEDDFDEDELAAGYTGTGYFDVGSMDLYGSNLYVTSIYGDDVSVASVTAFSDADEDTANDVGTLTGSLAIGHNGIVGIGTSSVEELLEFLEENEFLHNGSFDEEDEGAVLYLNGQVTVGNNQTIAVNGDADANDYESVQDGVLQYTSDDGKTLTADLGLGEDTVIVMTENAFADSDGEYTGTAITFAKSGAVVNGAGGDIVVWDVDTSKALNIFNDADNNGVEVVGEGITVRTPNDFMYAYLFGEDQGLGVQLQVNEEEAYQIMYEASNPVIATLIAYGNRNYTASDDSEEDVVVDDTVTDEDDTTAEDSTTTEDIVTSGNGANVTIVGSATTEEEEETVTEEETETAEVDEASEASEVTDPVASDGETVTASSTRSAFLDEVISTSHGAPAETAARLAVYGGAVQAALSAGSTSYEAIASRMGMGNKNSVLAYADNADGAGIWLAPVYKHHESDDFGAQGVDYGVDLDLYGVALGVDYTFAQNFRAGLMFNVGSGDVDGDGAGSAVDNDFDYWGVSIYGGFTYENFSIVADLGYTDVDNDLDASTGMSETSHLSADTDTESWTIGVTAQYKFELDVVDITPHIGLRYTRIDMDDYSVNSNTGKVADFDADSMDVFSIPVGVSFSKDIATASGWKVQPSLDLTITANAADDEFDGDVSWTGTNLTTATSTEVLDDFTYGASLGISAGYGSFSFGLAVDYVGSDNTDEYGVQANARFTF